MSLDGLPAAHLRVLLDGLPVFERYGLLLAGGYAFRAHEILHRPSQDLDFATRDDTPARAWHDRFVIRDIIDLHAVAGTFSYTDLENLARRHDPALDLEAILDHLAGVSIFTDEDFAEYGLDEPRIADLRNLGHGMV